MARAGGVAWAGFSCFLPLWRFWRRFKSGRRRGGDRRPPGRALGSFGSSPVPGGQGPADHGAGLARPYGVRGAARCRCAENRGVCAALGEAARLLGPRLGGLTFGACGTRADYFAGDTAAESPRPRDVGFWATTVSFSPGRRAGECGRRRAGEVLDACLCFVTFAFTRQRADPAGLNRERLGQPPAARSRNCVGAVFLCRE